jgi:4-amino-4-deoxy-L-arabinose transferase-like glycosyltransferase
MSSAPPSSAHSPGALAPDPAAVNWRWYFWAILGSAAVLFFARMGSRALWSSEFRWGEIAREMRVTSNYFWPTINGVVYYDKPLGSYWLVVLASFVTGGVNEIAARMPCAVAGLLGVALMMLMTRRLYDARSALLSGFILATSFSFVFFSRNASADVATVTGELAALLLFLHNEDSQDGWWLVWLWIIMAITSQMKGLLGFVLPLMVIGLYCTLSDGWSELGRQLLHGSLAARWKWLTGRNRWLFNRKSLVAIALGFAVYYAPFAISEHLNGKVKGLHMVWRENVVRFFHPFDHRGPFYLYVYVIFALMMPWAMMLPAALVEAHKRRSIEQQPARSDRFALVFFWGTFAFFTLSGSRRSYYILPLFPAAAILIARALETDELRSSLARHLRSIGYWLTAAAAIGGIVVMLPPAWILPGKLATLPAAPHRLIFLALWLVSAGGIVYAVRRFEAKRIAISMGLVAYCLMSYIYLVAMPAAEPYRGEKPFALATLELLHGDMSHLALYRTPGPLFYLAPQEFLPEFKHLKKLQAAVAGGQIQWLIVRRRDIPTLDVPEKIELQEASYPWENAESYRNKVVLIRIGAPPGAG